ncbi:MAG: AAA family ATPase [Ilumatobacteraceae bacterium]
MDLLGSARNRQDHPGAGHRWHHGSRARADVCGVGRRQGRARGDRAGAPTAGANASQGTILFLDEIHRFSKAQQDALLPQVEDGTLVLIGATTENPYFEVNPPLRSRSTLFRLEPLDSRGSQLLERGMEMEGVTAPPDANRAAQRPGRRRRAPSAHGARGGDRHRRRRR